MRRVRLFTAALAASAIALVGLAPAASAQTTTQIGNPPGALVHACVTVRLLNHQICVDL